MQLFTISNLLGVLFVAYLAAIVYKFFLLVNPLHGVDITGPTIDPLWSKGQKYEMICFLSTYSRFKTVDVSKLRETGALLHQSSDYIFDSNAIDREMHFALGVKSAPNITTVSKAFWNSINHNKTGVYFHVLISGNENKFNTPISSLMAHNGEVLHGVVELIKYDKIPVRFHHRYLLADFGLVNISDSDREKLSMPLGSIISYWKPEVSVKLVTDHTKYPLAHVPRVVAKNAVDPAAAMKLRKDLKRDATVEGYYKPVLHVDEIGLTTDKYVPLNSTVDRLPLKVSMGPMSIQRLLLLAEMEQSLRAQAQIGFTPTDVDDVRRLISETSISLLGITMLASMLHLFFEFLAMRSDVRFWNENKSLAGLSTRSLITDLISQVIVFLFLLDSSTSLLITVPASIGILIQLWKVRKATGLRVGFSSRGIPTLKWTRWSETEETAVAVAAENDVKEPQEKDAKASEGSKVTTAEQESEETLRKLTKVTLEADRFATVYLSAALSPLVLGFIVRSLIYEKHLSWYSWVIASLTGCVYTFGFVLMCPQLYINHQLKSVSHLPWNFLIYKFLNTFIDDLFAFIIRMPTMHRLSVFRDDVVFLIYLYQRWIYRVDKHRPVEK